MTGERIFSIIMMTGISFGLGGLFYWMGIWAAGRKDPMHFWSGSTVDPKTISDITAYNHANGRMWKIYSVPYWLTGIIGILSIIDIRLSVLSAVLIGIACTFGIFWLIWEYKRICQKFKVP